MEKKPIHIKDLTDRIVELGLFLIVAGLFFSNALKSIGLVMVSMSIWFHPDSLLNFKKLLRSKLYWVLLVLAGGYLLSAVNSADLATYWKLSRIKWAYFTFPLAVVNSTWSKHFLHRLLLLAVCFGIVQSGYGLYDYFGKNSADLARSYATGNFLETYKTGAHQVSILLSVLVLLLYDRLLRHTGDRAAGRVVLGVVCIFFFILVHLFAVRAGIILTYLFIFGYTVYRFRAEYKKLVLVLVVTVSFGLVLLMSLETVKHRVGYLRYDITQFINDEPGASQYTDSRRLRSLTIGFKAIEQHPWLGSGLGDLQNNCNALYRVTFPELDERFYYLPHSQFVFMLAAFGLLLGLLMCIGLMYPVYAFYKMRLPVYFLFGVGWILFALWDTPLGTLFGNCLFLLFIGFGLRKQLT